MQKIRFALLGCGRISQKHLDAVCELKSDIDLVAVCDQDKNQAKNVAQKYQCQFYTDYQALLANEKLDLIAICTPSGLHPQHGMQAAQKGIHVLTEKPMATNWVQAVEFVKACRDHNVQLHVVHQNRLNATVQFLKRALAKNRFGKIYDFQVNVFWTRPQDYYDTADWRGTWEWDGGAFMNQASHYVDLIQYLMGDIEEVAAYTKTLARNIEAEDTGVAILKAKNGALGTLNVTMLTYPQNLEGSFTILGEKGSVRLGGVALNQIEYWQFADDDEDDAHVQKSSYETASVYGFGHKGYYKNVIESLRNKKMPQVCGLEGLKSLELILAIYESSKTNQMIHLPMFERNL